MSTLKKQCIFYTEQLLPFAFRLLLVWYVIAVLLEVIFPGFISLSINLDLFLWIVIIVAVFSFSLERRIRANQNRQT
ncbi:MAG: hypothetical protein ABIG66_04105 [Candidatus Kerfeldbacteria bacterium]